MEAATRAARSSRTHQTMAAAVLAWAVTVAPAAFGRSSATAAIPLSILALLAGIGGPLWMTERRRVGRHMGLTLFLALCTIVWLLAPGALHPAKLSPLRAATGTVAWAIFALSWREVWPKPPLTPEGEVSAASFQARSRMPRASTYVIGVTILASVALVLLAFGTRDTERGLAAQALALTCSVAAITVSSTVALSIGKERASGPGRRFTGVTVRALLLLAVIAVGGAVYTLTR